MMTFGHSTVLDFLSWVVVLTLSLKVVATLALLSVGKEARDRPGWGGGLWWATKITPVIAVPCLIAIAWLRSMTGQAWVFAAMMVFVIVAVPLKIRRRQLRIANGASTGRLL